MYGYALLQPVSYAGFEFVEYLPVFTPDFIMNYDKKTNADYTLMVYVDYPVFLQPLHRDLVFFT